MKKIYLRLLILQISIFTQTLFAQQPPTNEIYIESLNYRGNGCEQGSVAHDISSDGKAMTILFDNFIVEADGRAAKKSCDVDLKMHVPDGWSFSLFCLEFSGFADLEQNSMGIQKVVSKFGRGSMGALGRKRINGPYSDDYSHLTQIPISNLSWSPCGGQSKKLKIRTTVGVKLKRRQARRLAGPTGMMTVDSIDGELKHHYGIRWRRCRPERARVNVYRQFNGTDHMSSLDAGEGVRAGYRSQGKKFSLRKNIGEWTKALFRCRIGADHFVSKDADCEGRVVEFKLGYINTKKVQGMVELLRCYNREKRDHGITTNPDECTANTGYRIEQRLGWVNL